MSSAYCLNVEHAGKFKNALLSVCFIKSDKETDRIQLAHAAKFTGSNKKLTPSKQQHKTCGAM